jgi:hypothetical protein
VSEPKVLRWAKAEAARLRAPGAVLVETGDEYDDSAKRAALELVRDTLGEAAYGAAVATLDAEAEAHGKHVLERQTVPKGVDWDAPAQGTHEALSALWERIDLGPDLLPVSAVWRVPEWRADDQPTG